MKLTTFQNILQTLDQAGVRYLVAGGLAVVAHGYPRLTSDLDLVLALDPDNTKRAFDALDSLGYRPIVPVTAEQFADAGLRRRWIQEKGMTVLNFFSERFKETPVDLFAEAPFDFDAEYRNAYQGEILPGLNVRFVSLEMLIAMKEQAARGKDVDDLQHLRWIQEERNR